MQTILDRLRAGIVYSLVALLVLLAVLVSVLRAGVEVAPEWRREAAAVVSGWLDKPVSMDDLRVRLVGFRPVFSLRGVDVGRGDSALRFQRLEVAVDLWESLLAGAPRPFRVGIAGLDLTAVRKADGSIELRIGDASAGTGLDTVPLPTRLYVAGGSLTLLDQATGSRLRFGAMEASLAPAGGGYRLRAGFNLPATLGGRAELVMESEHLPPTLDVLAAHGFASLDRVHVAALAELLPGLPRLDGRAGLDFWFDVADGRLVAATANVDAANLAVGQPAMALGEMQARLSWRRTGEGGWALDVAGLRLTRTAGQVGQAPVQLSLRRDPGANGAPRWRGAVSRLPLAEATAIAVASGLLDNDMSQRLSALQPGGVVRDLRFGVVAGGRQWRVSGELGGVDVAPVGHFPGVQHVYGRFVATDSGGQATLTAADGALRLPRLFRGPMPYRRLEAEAAWRFTAPGAVHVAVSRARAVAADGRLTAHGAVWVPAAGSPFLDIRAHLEQGDAGRTSRYLPAAIMPEELVSWLDAAIRGGRIPEADLILFGRAKAFPFHNREGVFDIQARVRDATFAYFPGWPALEAVEGRLHFHNAGMHIEATAGTLFDVQLQRAVADIPNLEAARLTVDGAFLGPGQGMLRALAASPLVDGEREAYLRRLQLSGAPALDLTLGVDFEPEDDQVSVDGALRLDGAGLVLPERELHIADITGTVLFDKSGLRWEGLSGRIPTGRIVSQARTDGRGEAARIVIDTVFPASLSTLLGANASWVERLSGSTQWLATVSLPGFQADGGAIRLMLDSDLRGIAVGLPEPFGKAANTAADLHAEAVFDHAAVQRISLRYGELASLRIVPGAAGLDAARIGVRLGGGEPVLPQRPGLAISGRLERLELSRTLTWPESATGTLPPVRSLDVLLGELRVGGWATAGPVQVTGRASAAGWRLELSGPGAAGELRLPAQDASPVRIALDHLRVRSIEAADTEGGPDSEPLPPFSVTVDQLEVDGQPWGRVALTVSADGSDRRAAKLTVASPDLSLQAEGTWAANSGRAAIRYSMDSDQVGEALARFGYARVVRGGAGHAEGELSWAGTLTAPSLETLDGSISLDLRDGSLPAVEPGAGKIVGLLNLAMLPRRLMLDFSDVVAEGLAFHVIEARLQLENGTARTDLFRVDGPAVLIRLKGTIDLVATRYDLIVTVIPKISSTLPLIGGLAGGIAAGPAVGAAILITQGVLDLGVDRLTQSRYRVVGDWSDPRVVPLQTRTTEKGGDERDASSRGPANGLR